MPYLCEAHAEETETMASGYVQYDGSSTTFHNRTATISTMLNTYNRQITNTGNQAVYHFQLNCPCLVFEHSDDGQAFNPVDFSTEGEIY